MTTYAITPDLMDRGRVDAARADAGGVVHVRFDDAVERATVGDIVLLDLSRAPDDLRPLLATGARVVGFAAHVDDARLVAAEAQGVEALPRSVFFRRLSEL